MIEFSGLLPKGYSKITYSVVDIGTITKAGVLLKTSAQMTNIVKFSATNELKAGQAIKPQQVRISVEKITLNESNNIALKELEVSNAASKDAIINKTVDTESIAEKLTSRSPANPEFHSSSPATKPILTEVESTEKIVKNSEGFNDITITKIPLEG